jgi:hypothetical protein
MVKRILVHRYGETMENTTSMKIESGKLSAIVRTIGRLFEGDSKD